MRLAAIHTYVFPCQNSKTVYSVIYIGEHRITDANIMKIPLFTDISHYLK